MSKDFKPYTDEEFSDIMTTCLEGGSNYWINEGYSVDTEHMDESDEFGNSFYLFVDVKDKDGEGEVINSRVTKASLSEAASKIINRQVKVSNAIAKDVEEERAGVDADSADALIQVAVFGEIVYG